MSDPVFVAIQHSLKIDYLQQWAGDILNDLLHVETYDELAQFHGKIIIIDTIEANCRFELVEKLLQQKNYLIFCNFFEANNFYQFEALYSDLLNKFSNYAVIGNNDKCYDALCMNLNEFYFSTASDPNKLRAISTTEHIFSKINKPFNFLFLNGVGRSHRVELWKNLSNNGTLQTSLHSWLSVKDSGDGCDIPVKLLPKEYESPYTNTEINGKYKEQWPRYQRLKSDLWKGHWVDGHIVPAQYIDTYFSVVGETNISDAPFTTEKIYKPILAGHPFIVASTPGYYDYLHNLGFETFSDYINESFDHEESSSKRLSLIADQIKILCSSNLDKFLSNVKEICLYNQKHYIDSQWTTWYKTHIKLKNFFQQTINELQKFR